VILLGVGSAAGQTDDGITVDQLLQRLLEARGGAESWGKVKTLEIEGTWTAFSETVPMTIRRMRPDLFRFDHVVLGAPTVLAFDGKQAWVQSAVFDAAGGQPINEDWKRNVVEEAPFVSKLLAYAEQGAAIELGGRERLEGREVWVLHVAPKDAPAETWYLDSQTFLETKRVSTTFDVFSGPGIQLEMETYYMDFRDVGGLEIPYREERHFGTRYNVLEATSIRVNPPIDASVFRIPAAALPAEASDSNKEEG
jgi:hypothetical protein